jgi:hypothetical protein
MSISSVLVGFVLGLLFYELRLRYQIKKHKNFDFTDYIDEKNGVKLINVGKMPTYLAKVCIERIKTTIAETPKDDPKS